MCESPATGALQKTSAQGPCSLSAPPGQNEPGMSCRLSFPSTRTPASFLDDAVQHFSVCFGRRFLLMGIQQFPARLSRFINMPPYDLSKGIGRPLLQRREQFVNVVLNRDRFAHA